MMTDEMKSRCATPPAAQACGTAAVSGAGMTNVAGGSIADGNGADGANMAQACGMIPGSGGLTSDGGSAPGSGGAISDDGMTNAAGSGEKGEKSYQAVLFDLDGTLSDSVPCILKCSRLVHDEMGLPWDEAEQRQSIGKPLYETALAICGEERAAEYLAVSRRYSEQYLTRLIRTFAGIPELLRDLRAAGVKTAVVTSRLKWGAEASCEVLGLMPYLMAVIAVEDSKTHKPNAEPALLALERLGVSAEQAIFVGDSPVDIACGKSAGTRTAAVGWGVTERATLLAAEPDHFCPTVDELRDILLPKAGKAEVL